MTNNKPSHNSAPRSLPTSISEIFLSTLLMLIISLGSVLLIGWMLS